MNYKLAHFFAFLFLCGIFTTPSFAQDPQYSQAYSNLLMLNPAFAGSAGGPRFALNYRNQWTSVPGNYNQGAFSYDQPFYLGRTTHGYGINIQFDRAGEGNLQKIDLSVNYAFEAPITDDHRIRFGVAGGFQQASIDFFSLRFPDQIDPLEGFIIPQVDPVVFQNSTRFLPDFHAGVAYFNPYFYVGFTANHLTEPEQRFGTGDLGVGIDADLPRKYTATGGLRIPIGPYNDRDRASITPVFLVKSQRPLTQVDAGLYINYDPMVFGVWYRNQDAVIALIGLKYDNFRFGYSYDYNISQLSPAVAGGVHEVSVSLELEQFRTPRGIKHKDLPCPRF